MRSSRRPGWRDRSRGKGIARPEQPREPKQSWRAQAAQASMWAGEEVCAGDSDLTRAYAGARPRLVAGQCRSVAKAGISFGLQADVSRLFSWQGQTLLPSGGRASPSGSGTPEAGVGRSWPPGRQTSGDGLPAQSMRRAQIDAIARDRTNPSSASGCVGDAYANEGAWPDSWPSCRLPQSLMVPLG